MILFRPVFLVSARRVASRRGGGLARRIETTVKSRKARSRAHRGTKRHRIRKWRSVLRDTSRDCFGRGPISPALWAADRICGIPWSGNERHFCWLAGRGYSAISYRPTGFRAIVLLIFRSSLGRSPSRPPRSALCQLFPPARNARLLYRDSERYRRTTSKRRTGKCSRNFSTRDREIPPDPTRIQTGSDFRTKNRPRSPSRCPLKKYPGSELEANFKRNCP